MRTRTGCRLVLAVCVLGSGSALLPPGPAGAATRQPVVATPRPASGTPEVADGHVQEIVQIGSRVVLGGSFTSAGDAGQTTTVRRGRVLAFHAPTGALDPGFAPYLNGSVRALLPGPDEDSVYVGGDFTTLDGAPVRKLVLLDLRTGRPVPGFQAPVLDGHVFDVQQLGGRLLVAGTFTRAGGARHAGLVALDAATGAVDPYLGVQVAGHHNYDGRGVSGSVGVRKLAVDPAGRRLVAIGNFKMVDGTDHDQAVMLDLTGSSARIAPWQTNRYDSACNIGAHDSYVRDVDFSPDGSYFVIVTTGGYTLDDPQNLCDAAARWESAATGSRLQPTWVDATGGDSLLSVAVTGTAVYVGGHQRWMNNPLGEETRRAGAVPRPGLAALDPANGLPLAWNPGRHPRGDGTYALHATRDGLYAGSDTSWIGSGADRVQRPRVAYFPLAGGSALPSSATGRLPARVFLGSRAGGDELTFRTFDGSTAGARQPLATSLDWSRVRDAFVVGGKLFYGYSDGLLHQRSFDGTTLGPGHVVQPYHDPAWKNVKTGSGQTYDGAAPSLYGAQLRDVTGMFFARGRLYYTRSGHTGLYSRAFTPNSGVVGAVERVDRTVALPGAAGMFLDDTGNRLYVARASDGALLRYAWRDAAGSAPGRPRGAASVVGSAREDWSGRALFNLP